MKTYLLHVPDDATDAVLHTALADLLRQNRITLEVEDPLLPLSEEEFANQLQQALASPTLSAEQARNYLNL